MLRDTEKYVDSERFIPERFISKDGSNSSVQNPMSILFGFGRRYECFFSLEVAGA